MLLNGAGAGAGASRVRARRGDARGGFLSGTGASRRRTPNQNNPKHEGGAFRRVIEKVDFRRAGARRGDAHPTKMTRNKSLLRKIFISDSDFLQQRKDLSES